VLGLHLLARCVVRSRNYNRGSEEIICYYQRPSFRLRSFLCLVQSGFPLLSGVVLRLGLRKYSVSNLEVAMRWGKRSRLRLRYNRALALLRICRSGKGGAWARSILVNGSRFIASSYYLVSNLAIQCSRSRNFSQNLRRSPVS